MDKSESQLNYDPRTYPGHVYRPEEEKPDLGPNYETYTAKIKFWMGPFYLVFPGDIIFCDGVIAKSFPCGYDPTADKCVNVTYESMEKAVLNGFVEEVNESQ